MLIILIFFQDFYKIVISKNLFQKILKKINFNNHSFIFFMYVIGYFSINLDDGLGWGYGYYNLNLNSFINPSGQNNTGTFSWSNF